MQSIVIQGGLPLQGEVHISGSKNAALPIMTASLLLNDKLTINNLPKLTDILTMKQLLRQLGASIEVIELKNSLTIIIDTKTVDNFVAPYEIVRKMRASIWVLGPLVARFGEAKVSLPGGCAIGARQVDLHLQFLEAMGATIEIENGYINAKVKNKHLQGTRFKFNKISVGATINAIMAACLAHGETNLLNCACEPEIVDLCNCLINMGAKIEGIGTSEIIIEGLKTLKSIEYKVIPDRIEAGTYMIAAAITKGNLKVLGFDHKLLENLSNKLIQAGIIINPLENGLQVKYSNILKPVDIITKPFPGFSTDLQAQFMSLMTIANGTSNIEETIFENRFMHVPELCRMGAHITINGNSAIVKGVSSLLGAEVMASDLRASVSLILAGLAASGKTKIRRIYHLDRGYQSLEEKLTNCGAIIQRLEGDEV